jgi:hypothetical protein
MNAGISLAPADAEIAIKPSIAANDIDTLRYMPSFRAGIVGDVWGFVLNDCVTVDG